MCKDKAAQVCKEMSEMAEKGEKRVDKLIQQMETINKVEASVCTMQHKYKQFVNWWCDSMVARVEAQRKGLCLQVEGQCSAKRLQLQALHKQVQVECEGVQGGVDFIRQQALATAAQHHMIQNQTQQQQQVEQAACIALVSVREMVAKRMEVVVGKKGSSSEEEEKREESGNDERERLMQYDEQSGEWLLWSSSSSSNDSSEKKKEKSEWMEWIENGVEVTARGIVDSLQQLLNVTVF